MRDYNWEQKEPDNWNEKRKYDGDGEETGDVGFKGALNDIGSKATKAVFDALGYKIVKTAYNPNYGLNKEIKVQLRRGKQGKLEYFSNN